MRVKTILKKVAVGDYVLYSDGESTKILDVVKSIYKEGYTSDMYAVEEYLTWIGKGQVSKDLTFDGWTIRILKGKEKKGMEDKVLIADI